MINNSGMENIGTALKALSFFKIPEQTGFNYYLCVDKGLPPNTD